MGGVAEISEHKLGTMHKHKHKLGTMQGVHLTSPLVSANVHNTIWHTAHCTWHTSHLTLYTEHRRHTGCCTLATEHDTLYTEC